MLTNVYHGKEDRNMKKSLLMALCIALAAALSIGGTMAYLQDSDSDVNVMTLGNVNIEQLEKERVDLSVQDSALTDFKDDFPLFPMVQDKEYALDNPDKSYIWGDYVTAEDAADNLWDVTKVNNERDKIVFVENTGKSDAYVRTWFAFEQGTMTSERFDEIVLRNTNSSRWDWADVASNVKIDDSVYTILVATYDSILPATHISNPSLLQVALSKDATNADVEALDGNGDGKYNILVVSQAIQTAGFETAGAVAALTEGFGEATVENHPFDGITLPQPTEVTPANINSIDFTAPGTTFSLSGNFGDITIEELGEGSILDFDDATIGALSLEDDAEVTGTATIDKINITRNSEEPIEFSISDAKLDVTNEIAVSNTEGKSILNISNSTIDSGMISVGGHTLNAPNALAEFNVTNSFISCEENALGSTIAIWGQSGVDSKIVDSEIHTYSRGWHQSEDANDNSITFQGSDHINVEIKNTNMHLYGARSIINARQYGNGECTTNFAIDDSLIWVVTKSSHNVETLPVWNATEITDSALIFTKGVYGSNPVVIKTDVYGNPVISGNYTVTTQCGWATDIPLVNQTLTIAENANVSVYDGAAEVNFVLSAGAKVVVESGATLANIGVKAADGYTLNTSTSNGVTTYSVTAN